MHLKIRLFRNLVLLSMLFSLLTFPAIGYDSERATGGIHLRLAFSGLQLTMITISGQINNVVFMSGHPVFILVTSPDLSVQVLKVKPTRDGFFETYMNFNYKSLPGKYSIEFAYIDKIDQSKNLVFDVEQTDIPLPPESENLNIIRVNNDAERFFEIR